MVGWLIAPSIGEQVRELRSALPAAMQRLQLELSRFAWLETLLDSAPRPDSLAAQPGVAGKVTGVVSGTLAAIANVVVVLVIALYLAADPRPYIDGTVRLFPLAHRDRTREVLHAMGHTQSYLLTPLIERRTVELPPALTLTALVVAALLFGWLGLLLAALATAALMVLVQMVYLEDTLGERNAR